MNPLHLILTAFIQGATELFPISSLGHAIIIPAWFDWNINQHDKTFLPFLVLLHAGTALALLIYFWTDWKLIAMSLTGKTDEDKGNRELLKKIIVATIPAVIVGLVLNHFLKNLFNNAFMVSFLLGVNGILLIKGDKLIKDSGKSLKELTTKDALKIGGLQCLALFPGISRSGVTIIGGLKCGLDHESSARFSFLMALPVIVGATVLEIPKLFKSNLTSSDLGLEAIAFVVTGITAYGATWFLMRYFKNNSTLASLKPFGWYCLADGIVSVAYFNP